MPAYATSRAVRRGRLRRYENATVVRDIGDKRTWYNWHQRSHRMRDARYNRGMTDHRDAISDLDETTRAIIRATDRLLESTRAIDTAKSLEGIKSRRGIRRNHKHSVSHKSYR